MDTTIKIGGQNVGLSLDNNLHIVRDYIIASWTWHYFITHVYVRFLFAKGYTIIRWPKPNHRSNWLSLIFQSSVCIVLSFWGTFSWTLDLIFLFRFVIRRLNPITDKSPAMHIQLNVRKCPLVLTSGHLGHKYSPNVSLWLRPWLDMINKWHSTTFNGNTI